MKLSTDKYLLVVLSVIKVCFVFVFVLIINVLIDNVF